MPRFVDLQQALKTKFVETPVVGIASVGGRVVGEGWMPTLTEARDIVTAAIGQGSLLTFNNPKERTRLYLGDRALADGHLWALRSFHLGLLFTNVPRSFREALAFCGRFHLSWQESEDVKPIVVLAHGSLRDWKKYVAHREDKAFKAEHRELLYEAWDVLNELHPRVFPKAVAP